MAELFCYSCNKSYTNGERFCVDCGKPLSSKVANSCINKNCQQFGKEVPAEQMYCGTCGKPTNYGNKIEKLI